MPPPSLWSGNLRLSLVLIPVRLIPAVSTKKPFRQIHEPSGTPIKQVKGVRDGDAFSLSQRNQAVSPSGATRLCHFGWPTK
jgi:non-homologous end joining protein Ku